MIATTDVNCWIVDSGASQHMTANRELLINYQEFSEPEHIALEDGRTVNSYGHGQVKIAVVLDNKKKDYRDQL